MLAVRCPGVQEWAVVLFEGCRVRAEWSGDVVGQCVEVSGNFDLSAQSARMATRIAAFVAHEFGHGFSGFADNDFLISLPFCTCSMSAESCALASEMLVMCMTCLLLTYSLTRPDHFVKGFFEQETQFEVLCQVAYRIFSVLDKYDLVWYKRKQNVLKIWRYAQIWIRKKHAGEEKVLR